MLPIQNAMHATSTAPFTSVFDIVFDTVVVGSGFAGYAAARTLANGGEAVLLVDATGDLLWEATRALNGDATPAPAAGEQAARLWSEWLAPIRRRNAADDRHFDPAQAEVTTAHELAHPQDAVPAPFRTLLYAAPCAVETQPSTAPQVAGEKELTSIIVATKSGPRRIAGRRWVDATERGDLCRLLHADIAPRAPHKSLRSFILHTLDAARMEAVLAAYAAADPESGATLKWAPTFHAGDFRIWRETDSATADGAAEPWYTWIPETLRRLRAFAPADGAPLPTFIVSHCAMADYPVYAAASPTVASPARNVAIASPGLVGQALATPAERFALGAGVAQQLLAGLPKAAVNRTVLARLSPATLPAPAVTLSAVDVLIAGAGTSGGIAAVAAGRAGARVLVFDFTTYPGGIGTGGNICSYCHGAKGGLATESDDITAQIGHVLAGTSPTARGPWHHDARKIALLKMMDAAGATFIGNALLAGVEKDSAGRVTAALAVIDGRLTRLPAAAFIDATGDGDLSVFAGAASYSGRPGDGATLAYSQSVLYLTTGEGRLSSQGCNFDAGWVDPADAEDLTRARLVGIAQHISWNHAGRPLALAPLLGLRQSRHVETDASVTMLDLADGRRYEDSVGITATFADTHAVDFEFESDEMAFYYWICHGFRHSLQCDMPYRLMLPRGLENVWIACRAAGVTTSAAYGIRMQRDIQRLGEAAGLAAAMACKEGTPVRTRAVDIAALQTALELSGAKGRAAENSTESDGAVEFASAAAAPGTASPVELPPMEGVQIWHVWRQQAKYRAAIINALRAGDSSAAEESAKALSFRAAAVLAMWDDAAAEPRLVQAIETGEVGPEPAPSAMGAFGQLVAIPHWLQAVMLLRRMGTERCLSALTSLARAPRQPLNVRTTLALTLERLAQRLGASARPHILAALDALALDDVPERLLPPSRSLWRALRGQEDKKLGNDRGADVRQDMTWQLCLVISRTRQTLGLAPLPEAESYLRDPRGTVRQEFRKLLATAPSAPAESPAPAAVEAELQAAGV
ncbi:FAD-dependent oxidoreductase [Verrucomicrobia bacterium LW23]|nr:FAD-dependent oxidoreductase [Verrucomicrobia bacterium LW23]